MTRGIILSGLLLTCMSRISAVETFSLLSVQQTILAQKNGQVLYSWSSDQRQSYSDEDIAARWGGGTNFDIHDGWLVMETSADIYPYPGIDWNGKDYWVSSTISALIEPVGSECEVHTLMHDEWWGCRSYARITNQTSGEQLFYADYFGGDPDGIYPLTAGDMYQIELYSGITCGKENWDYLFTVGSLNLSVLPATIPVPPSLLLSLSGVAALLFSRRLKQKPAI